MPPAQVVAYPLLLAATYGIYRVGRARRRGDGLLEHVRLVALALLAGVILAVQVRLAISGQMQSPAALWSAALSIAAVIGLVGLNILDWMDGFLDREEAVRAG